MRRALLVRHASHHRVGRILCGRMPGVSLSASGLDEARALAQRLAGSGATRIISSPQLRTRETAAPIAEALGLTVATAPDLDEIEFGAWTGRSLVDLADEPGWSAWNAVRGQGCPPGGESMAEVQARVCGLLDRLGAAEDPPVILVSHGDVIRAALLRVLGMSLDAYDKIVIAPASCSELALWPGGGRVVSLNERVAS